MIMLPSPATGLPTITADCEVTTGRPKNVAAVHGDLREHRLAERVQHEADRSAVVAGMIHTPRTGRGSARSTVANSVCTSVRSVAAVVPVAASG
jgi:hypothetical protein